MKREWSRQDEPKREGLPCAAAMPMLVLVRMLMRMPMLVLITKM